jgi:hypothetical protein
MLVVFGLTAIFVIVPGEIFETVRNPSVSFIAMSFADAVFIDIDIGPVYFTLD